MIIESVIKCDDMVRTLEDEMKHLVASVKAKRYDKEKEVTLIKHYANIICRVVTTSGLDNYLPMTGTEPNVKSREMTLAEWRWYRLYGNTSPCPTQEKD